MKIGAVIKKLRLYHGLTQVELADICFLRQASLSAIENDESIPTKKTLRILCNELNVSELSLYLLSTHPFELNSAIEEIHAIPNGFFPDWDETKIDDN